LIRGYAITTPRDAVCGFEGVDEDEALAYLEMAYGAKTTTVDELVYAPAAGHVYELAATRSAVAVWRKRDKDAADGCDASN
jgi:hypothetical protein